MNDNVKSAVLMIIDGFGVAPPSDSNAITTAKMNNWNALQNKYPWTTLNASGLSVGLPEGTMGNSEVGHLTIGLGRIIYQSYERINQSIQTGQLGSNNTLLQLMTHIKQNNSTLHLFGLVSDGGVHSHIDHLFVLLDILKAAAIPKVFVHAFTDGRDVPPHSGVGYIQQLLDKLTQYSGYELADVIGRYYAMDRDKRWDRTQIAYNMLTQTRQSIMDPVAEIRERYAKDETDEFLTPILANKDGIVHDNDGILFFNFRPDRARQLTMAFNELTDKMHLLHFSNLKYVTMTVYDSSFPIPALFPNLHPRMCLAEVYARHHYPQIHIAETEKYAHVTYFINGGAEEPFELEDRVLIPSNKDVATYDLAPEMSTRKIADAVINAINSQKYKLVILNFAAPDMVGHTANMDATVTALQVVDECIGDIYTACTTNNYTLFITADHGNCDKMMDEHGTPFTAHSTNPVPFLINNTSIVFKKAGGLSNIAPTLLKYVGLPIPEEMTSKPII